ncbi:hypothetical protein ACFVIM_23720 [Streptomyces sp. NPDC057638]|uniref:hypothetical protein n=1 Tax=Streptomyces sp. NPDC057638 TaxID=3346190 RepID=UPI0036BFCA09
MAIGRYAVAGAVGLALLVMLFGEYESDSDDFGGDEPKSSASAAAKGPVLDRDRTRALLPPRDVLKGWTSVGVATADDLTRFPGHQCSGTAAPVCAKAVSYGKSLHSKVDGGRIMFSVYGYQSAKAARSAFPHLWKLGHLPLKPPLTRVKIGGSLGEEYRAQRGLTNLDDPGATVQMRVGTTLLLVEHGGAGSRQLDEERLSQLAGMLAERSRQAQKGEKPSAKLRG